MAWSAYSDGKRVRYLLNPEDENLTGWSKLQLPADFDPAGGPWIVTAGKIVADTTAIEAAAVAALRAQRDARLAGTDWTQLADVPPAVAAAFRPFRQALRDMPETTADLKAPKWPAFPPGYSEKKWKQ